MSKGKGIVYIICGGQDVGKSAYVIENCKKSSRHTFVYDYQREYLERFGKRKVTIFYDLQLFVNNLAGMYNSNIIIEEGTTFIRFQKDEAISALLTSAFHNGNIIYILFHYLEAVPKYILSMSHVLVLFATGDDEILVGRTRPKLAQYLHKEPSPKFIKLQPF